MSFRDQEIIEFSLTLKSKIGFTWLISFVKKSEFLTRFSNGILLRILMRLNRKSDFTIIRVLDFRTR